MQMTGNTILITGGGTGIGLAFASHIFATVSRLKPKTLAASRRLRPSK